MRKKSLYPKRLTGNNDANDIAVETDNRKDLPVKQIHNGCEANLESNMFNGSGRKVKAAFPQSKQTSHKTSVIFTFDSTSSTNKPRKCSCHIPRKDESTQTPNNHKEWLINDPTPVAVNPRSTQPNLPSPSWSTQSSDSDGSLPRTPPNKPKLYKCHVCQKPFPTPSKLRRHFLIHSGEKPYSCRVCGKPFNDPANLKRHHWSHVKDKPFICEECNGQFMTKRDAMMHLCPAVKRKRKLEIY